MRRSRKCRMIELPPVQRSFKPIGVPARNLEEINLTIDEFEAIRLADYEELEHAEAAVKMDISRPTFTRVIQKAHKKVSSFLLEKKKLHIDGGLVHFKEDLLICKECGLKFIESFENDADECPKCGSDNLESIAAQYGHGPCCRRKMQEG